MTRALVVGGLAAWTSLSCGGRVISLPDAFDDPELAQQFYVNSRTGPILTRGPHLTTGTRELDPAAYLPALRQMRAMPRYSTALQATLPSHDRAPRLNDGPLAALRTWANLGPANQGGRTRTLIIDPSNPATMYAGGATGGVWKSTDGGGAWVPISDLQLPNLSITSLAFDPQAATTIYAGTGEGWLAGGLRGAGIFRSLDAGVTWTQLPSTGTADFYYTLKVIVSPRNSQRLYAATSRGVFRSTNGGVSWTNVVGATHNGCTDLAVQTGPPGYVFAGCGLYLQGALYRGLDDGVSAFQSVLSLPGQTRTTVAIAPSNQAVVYAMAAQHSSSTTGARGEGLHGVYRSTANGDPGSFTTQVDGTVNPTTTQQKINQLLLSNPYYALTLECWGYASGYGNQGEYDNVIAVDPLDPNRVWAGGIDLFRSDDGGVTWGSAGYWWGGNTAAMYHHADQHGIVFHPQFNGTTNRVLFSTNDGGIERLDDARAPVNTTLAQMCGTPAPGAVPWVDRNGGYVTAQFYDASVYPNGQTYFGGLQDNGTMRGTSASLNWTREWYGDGGYSAVDTRGDTVPSNDVIFLSTQGLTNVFRSTDGGANFQAVTRGIADRGVFIPPYTMNAAYKQHLWIGGEYIWRTIDQATTWTRASAAACGNGAVSAVATHPLDPNRVLVGLSDGCYHYHHGALGTTSSTVWPGGVLAPSSYVSWMAWDPSDVNVAYATVSSFDVVNVFKTTNGGVSWLPSSGAGVTAIPRIPARSVVVNPADSQQVFVGTDLGVFTSIDGGASWSLENTGFANVPVESLKINETAPYYLYAFTHGRGAWRVAIAATPTAVGDHYGVLHGMPRAIPAPGVLANDVPSGGGTLTATLVTTTTHGTLSLAADGGFTYTPAAGFAGADAFTYTATNTLGTSGAATTLLEVTAPGQPLPPSDLRVTGLSGTTVTFAWSPPAIGPVVTGYVIEGGLVPGQVLGALPLGPTPTVALTLPSASLYVRVRAIAGGATSVVSNEVLAHVNVPVVPSRPANLLGLAVGNTLALAWTPTFEGGEPTNVALAVTGAITASLPLGRADSFAFSGVPPGSYTFSVAASNATGASPASNAVTLTFPGSCSGAPHPPARFMARQAAGIVYLTWDPPVSGTAPTSYLLSVSGAITGTFPRAGRGLTTAAPPGTYDLRVHAVNACGTSAPTPSLRVTVP
ncbi:MAG: cadherin-like domain-containing protein [Acidobacteria bacterium]|nr:cadherin-like domain-containing protein [Acidobacteriota bacterium]